MPVEAIILPLVTSPLLPSKPGTFAYQSVLAPAPSFDAPPSLVAPRMVKVLVAAVVLIARIIRRSGGYETGMVLVVTEMVCPLVASIAVIAVPSVLKVKRAPFRVRLVAGKDVLANCLLLSQVMGVAGKQQLRRRA